MATSSGGISPAVPLTSGAQTLRPPHYPSITELQRSEPFSLHVARGLVAGHTSLNISGYQAAVTDTFIPIWENNTAYVYPAFDTMRLWSSSASDTAVLVRINGLDDNFNQVTESLLLTNGTTGVITVNSYLRINGIAVIGTQNPVGAISLGNSGKTETYAKIATGAGRSAMTIYSVPAGYTFYLAKVNAYTNQGNNQITNYRSFTIDANGIEGAVLQVPFAAQYISDKSIQRPYPELTDIQWQCKSSATSQVGLQIEGILIKNTI